MRHEPRWTGKGYRNVTRPVRITARLYIGVIVDAVHFGETATALRSTAGGAPMIVSFVIVAISLRSSLYHS